MPTPARGPQTTPPERGCRGATFLRTPRLAEPNAVIGSIVAFCIARRQLSSSCRRRLHATLSLACSTTGRPSHSGKRSAAAYSPILPNHVAEAVEAEGSPASSAAAQFSSACAPARQIVVSVLIRIGGCCSLKQNVATTRGLAWHVPCHVRCPGCLVRRRMFGLGMWPLRSNPSQGIPCRCEIPCRCGIRQGKGCTSLCTVPPWDTVSHGISCHCG
jgi:hypothetical protein